MQALDLQTTQNVTVEYELATLGERALALILDAVIVGVSYYLLLIIFFAAFDYDTYDYFSFLFMGAFPIACFMLYVFLCELLTHGQTIGKKALNIQVVRLDGEELVPGDYLLRSIFYIIDFFFSAGIIGGIAISATPRRQRIGDLTTGTAVIKASASVRFGLNDILRISSLADYEPRFPEVRQFSEQDMLTIKTAMARYQRHPNIANRNILVDLRNQLAEQLDVKLTGEKPEEFLKTLIRDYIVLTR